MSDQLMDEMFTCLASGPGVFVVKRCVEDLDVLVRANAAFKTIIDREREGAGGSKGDHFAEAGRNDRIWNSFQKHAEVDPESFVKYYSNDVLALACEAWLGPGYQITAQTNIVKPGGKAQQPHRDFHLGFQSPDVVARFPLASQVASQLLTLQLAIAHTDMPLDSGPTQLLPFSQQFEHGYLAYHDPQFAQVFKEKMIQVELEAGDAVFFSPALFHAAGDNRTVDFERSANLLQVSACWSKPMESVNRDAILRNAWPYIIKHVSSQTDGVAASSSQALLKAICDGYSFPTNLDKDPPSDTGHCPETQLEMAIQAAANKLSADGLEEQLATYAEKRKA
ncbi:hypothetical protein EHS25_008518 [Saitozyma podzolica]|uniref:Phytanoyl-CoA dioxygenase n=1 Tax=Saitozyma podzolica TaxID=1890683 RepID=A0A427YLZ2_9TREE|nr:hypothetical protein EHS25_008518 [Saitozyma podzolica]